MVRRERARLALAPDARSVPGPRLRGHAPADAGAARDPTLPRLDRALAFGRVAGGGAARRGDPSVAGTRLQPSLPSTCTGRRSASPQDGWPSDLTELPGVGRYTADAVRRFALGEQVLPVDTNVKRVLERTGGEFGPESAAALMDLGAMVCLARIPRCGVCPLARDCPSAGRRFEPRRKQSHFEGSFRQRRAETLRLVAAGQTTGLDADAVASLERDGLVEVSAGLARLPQ